MNANSLLLFLYLHISFKTFFSSKMEYYTMVKCHLKTIKLRVWKLTCKIPKQRIIWLSNPLRFYRLFHRHKEEYLWRMINRISRKYREGLALRMYLNSKSEECATFTTQIVMHSHVRTTSRITSRLLGKRLQILIKNEL